MINNNLNTNTIIKQTTAILRRETTILFNRAAIQGCTFGRVISTVNMTILINRATIQANTFGFGFVFGNVKWYSNLNVSTPDLPKVSKTEETKGCAVDNDKIDLVKIETKEVSKGKIILDTKEVSKGKINLKNKEVYEGKVNDNDVDTDCVSINGNGNGGSIKSEYDVDTYCVSLKEDLKPITSINKIAENEKDVDTYCVSLKEDVEEGKFDNFNDNDNNNKDKDDVDKEWVKAAGNVLDLTNSVDTSNSSNLYNLYLKDINIDKLFSILHDLKEINIVNTNSCKSLNSIINEVRKIYEDVALKDELLVKINSKGYINETDLSSYNLINDVIPHIITTKSRNDLKWEETIQMKKLNKCKILKESDWKKAKTEKGFNIANYLVKHRPTKNKVFIDFKMFSYETSKELFKWSYNLINLKLYMACEVLVMILKNIIDKVKVEEFKLDNNINLNDLLLDISNLSDNILIKLDPSIRRLLTKRGVSFTHVIYTGFDTEYVNKDNKTNKLLSAQLAVTSKTLLKLPLELNFDFELLNVETNKVYKNVRVSEDNWTISDEFVSKVINESVKLIRLMKYPVYDKVFEVLIKGLRFKGFKEVIKDDGVNFIFDTKFGMIKEWFKVTQSLSLSDIVNISKSIVEKDILSEYDHIIEVLRDIYTTQGDYLEIKGIDPESETSEINVKRELDVMLSQIEDMSRSEVSSEVYEEIENSKLTELTVLKSNKKYMRSYNQSISKERINVTRKVNNYIMSHLTNADLSMLSDFDTFKLELDIINKSFVTLGNPMLIEGVNVYIRDTTLLSPGISQKLEEIGSMYKDLQKIEIEEHYKSNMDKLLNDDPVLFKKYAMQDSYITLKHACFMELFYNRIGGLGVPLTLTSLSRSYIRYFWKKANYRGYQISPEFLLGNVSKTNTPKGFSVVKDVGLYNNYFIASYRGGRNESFMYGEDSSNKIWYDYDLISAYTTVMSGLATPDYDKAKQITLKEFEKMSWDQKIKAYVALNLEFEFPEDVKYPSIPCNVDQDTTVYPLYGKSVISQYEYITAKRQGCKFKVFEIVYIPFKIKARTPSGEPIYEKPYHGVISELQYFRSLFDKSSILNFLFKRLGNDAYGIVVSGVGYKLKYDARSKTMKRMEGNDLTNPIIASGITSFIRSVVSECLHFIHLLNGKAVSVTTDGFITDIEDLEDKIFKLVKEKRKSEDLNKLNKSSKNNTKTKDKKEESDSVKTSDKDGELENTLLKEYLRLRQTLSPKNKEALEVKKSGETIISWCTRGQLSDGSGIRAMTGFQRGHLSNTQIKDLVLKTLKTEEKSFYFLRKQLRSAKDLFVYGGQVTSVYSDQVYRVMFDNKRRVLDDNNNENQGILDTAPLTHIKEGMLLRYISKLPKTSMYSKNVNRISSKYKSTGEMIIRNFIKALMNNDLNLNRDEFKNYKEIVAYIKEFKGNNGGFTITENYISQLKRRGNHVKIPWNNDSDSFIKFVKKRFPDFNSGGLFITIDKNVNEQTNNKSK